MATAFNNMSDYSTLPNVPTSQGKDFNPSPLGYSQENLAIDALDLVGRQTDLRQLLKILILAKTGQPKSVLLSGDAGMGKTALIDGFSQLIRNGIYARVVSVDMTTVTCFKDFPRQLYSAMDSEANALFYEALETIQTYTAQLGFVWQPAELKQAVELVQLQSTIPTMGLAQVPRTDQVVRAIRNAMPMLKKWNPSNSDALDNLVNVLMNPWLLASVSWLKRSESRLRAESTSAQLSSLHEPDMSQNGTTPDATEASFGGNPADLTQELDDTITELTLAIESITQGLVGLQTALVFTFDHWDAINLLPKDESSAIKQLMTTLLSKQLKQPNSHQMWVVSCRTEGQSHALGSALYAQFRNKLLIDGLSTISSRQYLDKRLKPSDLTIEDEGVERLVDITQGNPYWLKKVSDYLIERASANQLSHLPISFIDKLNLNTDDLHGGGLFSVVLTQVKLACPGHEQDVDSVLAILLRAFGSVPWNLGAAYQKLPQTFVQGHQKSVAATILNKCLWVGLIAPVDKPEQVFVNVTRLESNKQYQFDGRLLIESLSALLKDQIYDDPNHEKLELLKQVIPMSVSSGELDPQKTQELISLSHHMNDQTLVPFLTRTLTEASQNEKAVVRASALNNLTFLKPDIALNLCQDALADPEPLVREYALRNLQQLPLADLNHEYAKRLYEQLFLLADDMDDTVRTYAYGLLAQIDQLGLLNTSLIPAFVKGMSDTTLSVRRVAIEALSQQPSQHTDSVLPHLLKALTDYDDTVRLWAYKGLSLHEEDSIFLLLANALTTDPAESVQIYAAEALSGRDHPDALALLTRALTDKRLDEKVKITIVRAMEKHPGWLTESTLLSILKSSEQEPIALLWVTIKALGKVAATLQTKELLQQYTESYDEVVRLAATSAFERVRSRIEKFHLYEQHKKASLASQPPVPTYQDDRLPLIPAELNKPQSNDEPTLPDELTSELELDDANLFATVSQ